MLKIENVEISGWNAAIRGMRNAMNSWDKSDSDYGCEGDLCKNCSCECNVVRELSRKVIPEYIIGPNDKALMQALLKSGPDHAKFMRFINVTVDITAPFYWWKEFRTYRAGRKVYDPENDELTFEEVVDEMDIEMNSCSTMHKVTAKEFEVSDFATEHLTSHSMNVLIEEINLLNYYRDICNNKNLDEGERKEAWWQIIQLLPSSYLQKRTVQLSYQALRAMYLARRNHKQDEWRIDFCNFVKSLPYMDILL